MEKPKNWNQSSLEEIEPLSFTKFYEMATVSPNTPVNGWQLGTSGKPDRQNFESKNSKVKPFTATYTSTSKRHARQAVTPTPNTYCFNYESNVSRGEQSVPTITPNSHLQDRLEQLASLVDYDISDYLPPNSTSVSRLNFSNTFNNSHM